MALHALGGDLQAGRVQVGVVVRPAAHPLIEKAALRLVFAPPPRPVKAEGKIRRQLIEENLLDAVIGLPSNLFYGTGISAAVLIFKRNKADDKVLFIDASREYQNDKNQNRLRQVDIDKIVATYQARETIDKYAYLASFDEIKENDFNLNIPRYVDTFEEEQEIDIYAVQVEIAKLETELASVKQEMAGYLKELGYDA